MPRCAGALRMRAPAIPMQDPPVEAARQTIGLQVTGKWKAGLQAAVKHKAALEEVSRETPGEIHGAWADSPPDMARRVVRRGQEPRGQRLKGPGSRGPVLRATIGIPALCSPRLQSPGLCSSQPRPPAYESRPQFEPLNFIPLPPQARPFDSHPPIRPALPVPLALRKTIVLFPRLRRPITPPPTWRLPTPCPPKTC